MPRSRPKVYKVVGFTPEQRQRIREDVGLMRKFMNRIYAGGPEGFGAAGGSSQQAFAWGTDHEVTLHITIARTSALPDPGSILQVPPPSPEPIPEPRPRPEPEPEPEPELVVIPAPEPVLAPQPLQDTPPKKLSETDEDLWTRLSRRLDVEDEKQKREDLMLERMRSSRKKRVREPPTAQLEDLPVMESDYPAYRPPQQPENYSKRVSKRQYAHVPTREEYELPPLPIQKPAPQLAPANFGDPRVLQAYSSSGSPTMRLKTV